eukprot:1281953-Pyramimonas_sp.AAC.1
MGVTGADATQHPGDKPREQQVEQFPPAKEVPASKVQRQPSAAEEVPAGQGQWQQPAANAWD